MYNSYSQNDVIYQNLGPCGVAGASTGCDPSVPICLNLK